MRTSIQILLFTFATLTATAQVTLYRFTGTVVTVGGDLGSNVQVGNSFQADFQFDESVPPQLNTGSFAIYKSQLSEVRITSSGAGLLTWTASTPSSNNSNHGFTIDNNNSSRDTINFSVASGLMTGPDLNSRAISSLVFSLIDNSQTAFSSTSIPTFLNPSSFNSRPLELKFGSQLFSELITFNLSSIEKNPAASPIPEPSTYAAIIGGLALAGVVLRRRFTHTAA